MNHPPLVEIRGVSFSYDGYPVLQNVDLDICQDDFIALIGPNGGGKTTLLKLILGVLTPQEGVIRVLGIPPPKASHTIGYVPQNVHDVRHFPITAIEVVLMGKLAPGIRFWPWSKQDRTEALGLLERMDMASYAGRRIDELSGGQRQRVLIARALVSQPRLLLLDEPIAGIDSKGQGDFFKLLKEINASVALLLVSHDLMVISTHVKSVACVNRSLYYHAQAEITEEMLEMMYPSTREGLCPVELLAHGLPHRVLKGHGS